MTWTSKKFDESESKQVNREKALAIANQHCLNPSADFQVFERLPDSWSIYNLPDESCWFILAPWASKDGLVLRSSRALVISKATGKILYDGQAGDEG